jgi:hypothetical protein
MTFQLAPAIILNGYYPDNVLTNFMLSDHSRQPFSISNDRYEKSVQLANGLTRKYVISSKRSINLSWDNLPSHSAATVDHGAGAADMERFYKNNYNNEITAYLFKDENIGNGNRGTFTSSALYIDPYGHGVVASMPAQYTLAASITVFIDSFSIDINKRFYGGGTPEKGRYDLWNVSLTLKEV